MVRILAENMTCPEIFKSNFTDKDAKVQGQVSQYLETESGLESESLDY